MPNCFGAVDGKHIKLKCPPNSGSCYYNYKKYFSIVLMAICDHLYRFKLVDIEGYGGNSGGGIFHVSTIGQNLENDQLNLPKDNAKLPGSDIKLPGFFIGDAAFPLTTRIMKPYCGSNLTIAQKIFNYRHSRARRTIESLFGILANRWQVFHKSICMLPQTADKRTLASVCLHNFLMYEEQKDASKEYSQEIDSNNISWLPVEINAERDNTQIAITQRDMLCNYFVSLVGKVDFQYDYIRRGTYRE
ncbi:protein ALP1-like [Monomorium pharaonis]|uniref:protein ALP1-like n=1 Tax=Monomorium pharaonis TaxID=307658 RepID=UPI00102E1BA6|nr:protein ALP1-like [Monomorium pharaonis]XP_036144930.1 protein ALP1-like [Monomorium pharaonis]